MRKLTNIAASNVAAMNSEPLVIHLEMAYCSPQGLKTGLLSFQVR